MSSETLEGSRPIFDRVAGLDGYLLAAIGATLFSAKGILIKLAYQYGVEPVVLMTLRMLFGLPVYLFVLWHQLRKFSAVNTPVSRWLCVIALGVCGYYLASWLDLLGLLYVPASIERIIIYTYPMLVVLMNSLIHRRIPSVPVIAGVVIVYCGLLMLFVPAMNGATDIGGVHLAGDMIFGGMLIFGSAVAFALFFVGSERLMLHIPSQLFTAVAMLSANVVIATHFIAVSEWQALVSQANAVYGYAFLIAIFATVLPTFLIAAGIKRIGASRGAIIGGISPSFTLILGVIFLQESMNMLQFLGYLVVMLGVMSVGWLQRRSGS
ncbi:Uncharacterised protein [BD1-7 clade bacterium]|uniref:EamA domain-containing protein n=1 Tax=BD1-7 clade bacterium TaxID=2029982 RepID=A0A5S9QFJ9_9GAMM|nr:Uncharacterised protein [BD1-7 clade bacterium]CAA0117342.1 Uncharacterised protein [BD1-7 clade bacterium]